MNQNDKSHLWEISDESFNGERMGIDHHHKEFKIFASFHEFLGAYFKCLMQKGDRIIIWTWVRREDGIYDGDDESDHFIGPETLELIYTVGCTQGLCKILINVNKKDEDEIRTFLKESRMYSFWTSL